MLGLVGKKSRPSKLRASKPFEVQGKAPHSKKHSYLVSILAKELRGVNRILRLRSEQGSLDRIGQASSLRRASISELACWSPFLAALTMPVERICLASAVRDCRSRRCPYSS